MIFNTGSCFGSVTIIYMYIIYYIIHFFNKTQLNISYGYYIVHYLIHNSLYSSISSGILISYSVLSNKYFLTYFIVFLDLLSRPVFVNKIPKISI